MVIIVFNMAETVLYVHCIIIFNFFRIYLFTGCSNFVRDVEFMIGEKLHWWWPVCWKYITPVILSVSPLFKYKEQV